MHNYNKTCSNTRADCNRHHYRCSPYIPLPLMVPIPYNNFFFILQVIWNPATNSINVYWQIDSDDVEKKNKVKDLLNSKASKLR